MKSFFAIFILFLNMLNAEDKIRFAPLPMENAAKTLEIFSPLLNYLKKNLNKKIEVIYKGTNQEIVEGLIDNTIDIAYLGPLPYIDLKKKSKNAKAIIQFLEKSNKETYTCTMFTRNEDSADLSSIKNKKFAMPQKYSTCGYVFAQEILKENGLSLDHNRFEYAGSHYNCIVEVLSGDYDIGTAKTTIFEKFKYLGLKPIAISKPNPGLVLVANYATLNQKTIIAIQKLLLEATDKERSKWGNKIKNKSIVPNEALFKEYAKRVDGIVPKDEK